MKLAIEYYSNYQKDQITFLHCKKMDIFHYNCAGLWGRDICILFVFYDFS